MKINQDAHLWCQSSGGSRIFPGRCANSQNCYYFSNFCQKLHENERIWTLRGARVPCALPRSANAKDELQFKGGTFLKGGGMEGKKSRYEKTSFTKTDSLPLFSKLNMKELPGQVRILTCLRCELSLTSHLHCIHEYWPIATLVAIVTTITVKWRSQGWCCLKVCSHVIVRL